MQTFANMSPSLFQQAANTAEMQKMNLEIIRMKFGYLASKADPDIPERLETLNTGEPEDHEGFP